jgi:heme/copper-type cytochrome/quinol oxidase subunit 2
MRLSLVILLALLVSLVADGQYVRRGRYSTSPAIPGAYKGVAGEFHGKLKEMGKKEIVIETEDRYDPALEQDQISEGQQSDQALRHRPGDSHYD